MKIKLYILLVAALQVFVSCGNESPVHAPGEGGEKVIIHLSTASRSDGNQYKEGDLKDREVTSLRLLAFKHSTGVLYRNYKLALPEIEDPQTIEILTGRYNFVFIANEGVDPVVAGRLNDMKDGESLFSELDDLFFSISAFNSTTYIPMVTVCREIVIVGERKYIDTNIDKTVIVEGVWPVELERLGVRVDAQVKFRNDHSPDNWDLFLENIPDRAYLLPAVGQDRNRDVNRVTCFYGPGDGDGQTRTWIRKIIIPENVFDPETVKANAIKLGVKRSGVDQKFSAPIGFDLDTKNYTLPRNLWVGVDAEVAEEIVFGPINVTLWEGSKNVDIPLSK